MTARPHQTVQLWYLWITVEMWTRCVCRQAEDPYLGVLALECPERDGPERLPSMLIYTMACGQPGRFTQIDATVQASH